jgi:hypothetical protein
MEQPIKNEIGDDKAMERNNSQIKISSNQKKA